MPVLVMERVHRLRQVLDGLELAELQAPGTRATFSSQMLMKCRGSFAFILSREQRQFLSFTAFGGKNKRETAALWDVRTILVCSVSPEVSRLSQQRWFKNG